MVTATSGQAPVKLNAVEKAAMNNPARRALQRHYEIPLLQRLASQPTQAEEAG